MSEVQPRGSSSRGRGSYRGGRGGYRGARGGKQMKVEEQDNTPSIEDEGEVGELKAKYSDKLPLLREVCEGWGDEDLVFALQEVDGDVEAALDKIISGSISQWGEVKKKQPKVKESTPLTTETNTRGRGRGGIEGRGRGRGSERATRAGRAGRAVSQANGSKQVEKPIKTTDEVWGDSTAATTQPVESEPTNGESTAELANEPDKDQLASLLIEESKAASASAASSTKVGGWAGLFARPAPAPTAKKVPTPTQAPVAAAATMPVSPPVPVSVPEESVPVSAPAPEPVVEEPAIDTTPFIETPQLEDGPSELPSMPDSEAAIELTPSKDELTEKNLDKLPDISHPVATATAASTTASTQDPMHPAVPAAPAVRPGMSGYAASALKATSGFGRSASYSRKLMEQQEAVVMPGNHAVDRASVQFGKMGMNGDDDEADEEREDPETRTQLPDDSPAAPRASLPPTMAEAEAPAEAVTSEASMPRPAPGLPPAPHNQQSSPPQALEYSDQYRYGQGQGQGQKAYDPFTQQPQSQGPATTEAFSSQVPAQSQGHQGSAQDYSQYYGANSRDAYQQYYAGYGHSQDSQRSTSAYGTSAQDAQSQYATARPQQAYGQQDAQDSGHNTPNPGAAGQQGQQSQHLPGQTAQGGQGGQGAYPYGYPSAYGQQYPQYGGGSYMGSGGMSQRYGQNRPMFDDVRRGDSDYYGGNQYGYGHNQQQYGGSYKSNMYAQPQQQQQHQQHQQHQYTHDYAPSPVANSGFGARETAYGRTGSTQPSETQQSAAGNNAFGAMPDPFGRTSSGFGQAQGHGGHQGSSEDQAKASGPSPLLQGNRPGSALNNMSGHQQGGLPHQQSQHSGQGFAGYPQYAGFGGNQSHQSTGYGSGYGSNAAFSGYGRGYGAGWSGSYGSGQH